MACPHCGQPIRLENYVYNNVETYGISPIAATLCCGNAVRVHRVMSFRVEPASNREGVDDWGVKFRTKAKEVQS